jgi:ParB family chromosome partitioning protein
MAATNRLGRGLGSILDDVEDAYRLDIEENSAAVKDIYLSDIVPNIYQPRKAFDEEALKELSHSLVKHGQLQPIVVVEKDDGYMIIAGERRYRASKLADFTTIKAIVADYDSENLRELALIENIQRENLSPLELAESYSELIKEYKITQEELSDIIHKSRSQITNTLRLLSLSPYTKDLLVDGKITQGHARVLVGLDAQNQKLIADTIVGQKLNVRESEELVKGMKANPEKPSSYKVEKIDIKSINDRVKELVKLGFMAKKSGNKLIITFNDEDEVSQFSKILISN